MILPSSRQLDLGCKQRLTRQFTNKNIQTTLYNKPKSGFYDNGQRKISEE